eukprot:gene8642-34090_t
MAYGMPYDMVMLQAFDMADLMKQARSTSSPYAQSSVPVPHPGSTSSPYAPGSVPLPQAGSSSSPYAPGSVPVPKPGSTSPYAQA